MCRVLEVTRQGFYQWLKRPPSQRDREDLQLRKAIKELHDKSRGTYGRPRLQEALKKQGVSVGKARLARAMRREGIRGLVPRSFRRTTVRDEDHPVAPNVLNRDFSAQDRDRVWVTDITYIRLDSQWGYLAAIIDVCSREVVGWSLSSNMKTQLPMKALKNALETRRPGPGLLHHSDRGCQYTSFEYRQALKDARIVQSMSRKGDCWDNAVAESFFATLKRELIDRHQWASFTQLRAALFDYIELFYNRQRLHSAIGYNTPAAFCGHNNAADAA